MRPSAYPVGQNGQYACSLNVGVCVCVRVRACVRPRVLVWWSWTWTLPVLPSYSDPSVCFLSTQPYVLSLTLAQIIYQNCSRSSPIEESDAWKALQQHFDEVSRSQPSGYKIFII